MGNTTSCSVKPSSPSKKSSPMYKYDRQSPLPTPVHRYKEQINPESLLYNFSYGGNIFITHLLISIASLEIF